MSVAIYVLDTSYLDELFGCEGYSDKVASERVRKLFDKAGQAHARFFVPLPCLFELGDHIAQIKHDAKRGALARKLVETVTECLIKEAPWTITPTEKPADLLPSLMQRFEPLAAKRKIGLVDAFVIEEADRLKKKSNYGRLQVHIWTNDRALKGFEPDKEPNPYLW